MNTLYYSKHLKGLGIAKNENLYILATAQTNWLQSVLVAYEAPFMSNFQNTTTGPVGAMTASPVRVDLAANCKLVS